VEEYNTLDHNLAAYVHVIGQVSTAGIQVHVPTAHAGCLSPPWHCSVDCSATHHARACPALQAAGGADQSGQTFAANATFPQPSDSAASGFYITNPNNRLTNNAASGGYSGAGACSE
jgi:hypothetical protein